MVAELIAEPLPDHLDDPALAEVARLFYAQLSPLRLHPGAALAVYRGGRLVLDLTGGWADSQRAEPVGPDTLFYLFSGTKPLVSVALHQQIERGKADLDEPVAACWPAFGQNGKAMVTLRHVLSHRGGFPTTPPELPAARWADLPAVLSAIAAMPVEYEPGAVSAYHWVTQQWVCAELVRRLDGRPIQVYLREEITGPLGMTDTHLGLPAAEEHRLVKLHATDGTDAQGIETLRALDGLGFHRLVVPGGSGVSTARDMARFYAAIAAGGALDGASILCPETVALLLQVEVDGAIDPTFDVPVRRGLGFELGGLDVPKRQWAGAASTARTFWHGGFGTSVCWGDPDLGLAFAFLTNGVRRDEAGAIARRDLSDAARQAGRRSVSCCADRPGAILTRRSHATRRRKPAPGQEGPWISRSTTGRRSDRRRST
jgi:CubicO group peptidase (beta-lactamase class C family)